MSKVVGAVLGAVGGTFLLGTAGYLSGLLFLAWYGPQSCCGLEGLLPPIVGTVTGASLGVGVGAMTGILVARRAPLKLLKLLVLVGGGVALAWVLSLLIGPVDIERIPNAVAFIGATVLVPVIVWITDAWEKPESSI